MNSRFLFRQGGQVIRTRSLVREALTALVAVVSAVLLLAWGHAVDAQDGEHAAYAAGLAVGRQQMAEVVGDAYRQGELAAQAALCPAQAAQSQQRGAP
jgi:hypothetical protein